MTRSEIELEALRSVLRLATHIEQAHGSSLHNPGDMLDELAEQLRTKVVHGGRLDACLRCQKRRNT